MQLYEIYRPLTASPFDCNEAYKEWQPCQELKPYICCFWGSEKHYIKKGAFPVKSLITPDTCVDIIFNIDFSNNRIHSMFCGMNDTSFTRKGKSREEKLYSRFAIRFYAWAAVLFSEESMSGSRNRFFEVDYHFSKLKKALEPMLFDAVTMEERIRLAEKFLLGSIHRERSNPLFMDAVFQILRKRGAISIGRLAGEVHAGSRTLERLFQENIGTSPKRFASLVRYQNVWCDILCKPDFSAADTACQYGYSDQAHLAHDFKRFHSMSMAEARKYAYRAYL